MTDQQQLFGLISVILGFIAYAPYWYGIYKGETKPHGFSWMVWALVTGIAYFAQVSDGAGAGAWAIGITCINCFGIAMYGFWRGEKERTRSDWITFIVSLAIIPIWLLTDNVILAVALVCIIDSLATWPTFRKSIMKPWDEPISTHGIAVVKYVFAMMALGNVSFVTAAYLVVLLILDGLMTLLLIVRRPHIAKP